MAGWLQLNFLTISHFIFYSYRDGTRLSSARAFLRPARDRPNLDIMLNTTVTKILFDEHYRRRAYAVEFINNGKKNAVGVRKEVILAAGTINSPQLLLLSGIGSKEQLDKMNIPCVYDLPGVGKNLQNHVAYFVNFLLEKVPDYKDLTCASVLEYMLNHTGPMSSTGMSQLTAILNTKFADSSGEHPDLQMFFAGYLANCASSCETTSDNDIEESANPKHFSISPVVLHPKSRGEITLRSADPLASPRIKANYLTEPEDMATLIEGIRLAQQLANATILKDKYSIRLDIQPEGNCGKKHEFDTDDYWECAVRYNTVPENHQVGTCKMGPSTDPMAVVSSELKVHGVEGLRIADGSVIPMIISGNTAAPIMMIAEKAASLIRTRWERGTSYDPALNDWDQDDLRELPSRYEPWNRYLHG